MDMSLVQKEIQKQRLLEQNKKQAALILRQIQQKLATQVSRVEVVTKSYGD